MTRTECDILTDHVAGLHRTINSLPPGRWKDSLAADARILKAALALPLLGVVQADPVQGPREPLHSV